MPDPEDPDVEEGLLLRLPDRAFAALKSARDAETLAATGSTGDAWLDDYAAKLEADP